MTVKVVEPVMLPLAAEISDVPAETAVAIPALVMLATAGVPDDQVTCCVRSCVLESE